MNMNAVESATLAAIGYDGARGILQLEFRSRAVTNTLEFRARCMKGC